MSILDYPRLNFRGIFKTNPCTANNDDVLPAVVTRDTNELGPNVAGLNDDQAMEFLSGSVEMRNYEDGSPVRSYIRTGWNPYGDHTTSFEQTTITSVVTQPPMGTPESDAIIDIGFEIIGSQNPDGTGATTPMIVDLDPTGLVSTQLFVGGVRFFKKVGGQKQTIYEIFHDTRAFQNWLNFNATLPATGQPYGGEQNFVGIACVWQFVIPGDKLPAFDELSVASPALQALLAQAQQQGGLAVRFKTYEVEPGYTDTYLAQQFGQGNNLGNPAYGYLIGTIGVWGADEPQSEPAGRKLEAYYRNVPPSQYSVAPGRPDMAWGPNPACTGDTGGGVLPGCAYPWMGAPALIGNAVALVRQNPAVISLDILESFPKYGFRNPNGPQTHMPPEGFDKPKLKADVGVVELAVIPAGATEADAIPLGDVDYGLADYSTYEDFGGIVDIRYDPTKVAYDTIAKGQLILRGKPGSKGLNAGLSLLKEQVIRVVTDDRTAYLTPEDTANRFHVKVYDRGGPTSAPVQIYLNEYKTIIQIKPRSGDICNPPTDKNNSVRTNQSVDSRTAELTVKDPDANPAQCPTAKIEPARLAFPAAVTIPAGYTGWFPIAVTPNTAQAPEGGTAVLGIQQEWPDLYGTVPPKAPGEKTALGVAGVPMWSTMSYSSVRVFEKADFSSLYKKAGGLQWDDVYHYALRYYFLLFPAMSAYIPLNFANSITSPYAAKLIKQRLGTPADPVFYTTLNMPVTRTLSPARVKLVLDFINQAQ